MNKTVFIAILAALVAAAVPAQQVAVFFQAGHTDVVNTAQYSPDGKLIATASSDSTIKLWDAQTGRLLRNLTGHELRVTSAAFSPDGKKLVSGSNDKTIKIWDTGTGNVIRTINGHTGTVTFAAWSPDGRRIASTSIDKTVKIWNPDTGSEIISATLSAGSSKVVFSPDSRTIAVQGAYNSIKIIETDSGKAVRTVSAGTDDQWIEDFSYSGDGKSLVAVYWEDDDNTSIKLWDTGSGRELKNIAHREKSNYLLRASFSPNGRQIVSGTEKGTIKIWDAAAGTQIRAITGHSGSIQSIAFSPDGRRILSGSGDNTARIWDAETGAELLALTGGTFLYLPGSRLSWPGTPPVFPTGQPGARDYAAAAYMQAQALRFLEPANRALTGQWDAAVQAIQRQGNISQTDLAAAVRARIGAVVDAEFSKPGRQGVVPAAVYADWQKQGLVKDSSGRAVNGVDLIKKTLTDFFLNPSQENYVKVKGIIARINSQDVERDPLYSSADLAWSNTLKTLSPDLQGKIRSDFISMSVVYASAKQPDDPAFRIFEIRYR